MAYTRDDNPGFMIDEATLATMLGAFLWLVYHCREWKRERSEFSIWMNERAGLIGQVAGDVQEVLEDILDGLTNGPAPSGSAQSSGGFGELLTTLLVNQMNIPKVHGSTQNEERQIQQEVDNPSSSETENELD